MLNSSLGALQEFNIQKLQQLDAEKAKIRKEYEKKESSGDAKKKMYASSPAAIRPHQISNACKLTWD